MVNKESFHLILFVSRSCFLFNFTIIIVLYFRMVSRLDLGFYIVNPDQDLKDMEKRLVGFLEKRMPDWQGIKGNSPSYDEFGQALINNNIFV